MMNKKTILISLAASLLLGGAASALPPSDSYKDSLIRTGNPVPMSDNLQPGASQEPVVQGRTLPPSESYKDSLIRMGRPVPTADNRQSVSSQEPVVQGRTLPPSDSYKDSLIRAGRPIPTADGRQHVVTNPRLIPSQTAPVRTGTPDRKAPVPHDGRAPAPASEKRDLPALRYRGHGPARMPEGAKSHPKRIPTMGDGYAPHDNVYGTKPVRMSRPHERNHPHGDPEAVKEDGQRHPQPRHPRH